MYNSFSRINAQLLTGDSKQIYQFFFPQMWTFYSVNAFLSVRPQAAFYMLLPSNGKCSLKLALANENLARIHTDFVTSESICENLLEFQFCVNCENIECPINVSFGNMDSFPYRQGCKQLEISAQEPNELHNLMLFQWTTKVYLSCYTTCFDLIWKVVQSEVLMKEILSWSTRCPIIFLNTTQRHCL